MNELRGYTLFLLLLLFKSLLLFFVVVVVAFVVTVVAFIAVVVIKGFGRFLCGTSHERKYLIKPRVP